MNLCSFGLHDWDKYGDVEVKLMGEFFAGVLMNRFTRRIQTRKCKRCGLIDTKTIGESYVP